MKTIRILHLIDSGGIYGAEIVILNLMEAQKGLGFHPILLSIGDTSSGLKAIEDEAQKRKLDCVSLRFKKGFNPIGTRKILNVVKKLNIHVLHSHGYKSNILLGFLARKKLKLPLIVTLHGWTSKKLFSKLWFYKCLDAIAIKRFDKVVAVSSKILKDKLLRTLGIQPVVINNGIPRLNFNSGKNDKIIQKILLNCNSTFKIISIGRLSPEKGFDVLIRSLSKLVSYGVDFDLVIIGEGSERDSLVKLAQNGTIANKVHFAGYQDAAFLFIPYFDAFILPSYTEGFPITLLEAMQAGTAIIASGTGDIPKILDFGRCGELCTPGASNELAAHIHKLYLDREKFITKIDEARSRVLNLYTVDKMAINYAELYNKLMKQYAIKC